MDKKLESRAVGLNCDYIACGRTESEVIQKVGDHIQAFHLMEGFSKGFYDRALSSIHDGICALEPSSDELLCQACSGTCTC